MSRLMRSNEHPFGDPALQLPRLTPNTKPSAVKQMYLGYRRAADQAREVQQTYIAQGASLRDRWGASCVVQWADACADACWSWLRSTARRGGRGVVCEKRVSREAGA